MKRARETGQVEGEKTKKKEESSASSEFGKNTVLNDDVLFEILLRLPARSVLRLRRVCKSWHSHTTDPSFVRKHTRRHCDDAAAAAGPKSILIQYDPFLIPSPNLTLCVLNADDIDSNRIRRRIIRIPVKPEYAVDIGPYCTYPMCAELFCDGLLCFMSPQGPNPYYICNPITKTWTSVAESLRDRFRTNLRGFYFHRSTGEYRLLQYFLEFMLDEPLEVGYEVATVSGGKDKSWRNIYQRSYLDPSVFDSAEKFDRLLAADIFSFHCGPQVVVNENLHWLSRLLGKNGSLLYDKWNDVEILVFDTSSEEFRSIPIPFKIIRQYSRLPVLLQIKGNLCIGRPIGGGEIELWLLKEYNSQEWVKMHSVITKQGITMRPSEEEDGEEEGNLFRRWGRDGEHFSFYNLKRKTCCYTKIQRVLHLCNSTGYIESLVTV